MIRRSFWFVLGVLAGAYGVVWARRNIENVSRHLTPTALLEEAVKVVTALARGIVSTVSRIVDAVRDGAGSAPV